MRLHRLFVIGPVSAVLVTAAYIPAVHFTSDQPSVGRVAGPPIPGAPAGVTAFVDVAVVPMDKDTVLSDQTVLVEKGRIAEMGAASQVHVPDGAVRIDGRGKFLLPGLADMHAHISGATHHIGNTYSRAGWSGVSAPEEGTINSETHLFLWLANGVTTVRNVDYHDVGVGNQALRLRAEAAAGTSWIPRIYTAGPWAPPNYLHPEAEAPVIGRIPAYIASYKAAGYDFVKIHDEQPAVLDAVLAAAKKVGIPVVGHVPPPTSVEHVLPLGYKCIEHPLTDYKWRDGQRRNKSDTAGIAALASEIRNAGIWNCPTEQHYDRLHGDLPKLLKIEQDSGVKLLLGTDELPWLGVIARELQAMVEAGLTPYQALLTGTRNVAEYFGTLDQSGTIAVGKRADMVLLTGNPLQDVHYTAQPAGVILGGRWLPRKEIEQRVATLRLTTFTDEQVVAHAPVKSYWQNVIDNEMGSADTLLYGITWSRVQQAKHRTPEVTRKAQRQALGAALGTSDQYVAGSQRVFDLIAKQLGELRGELTPAQRATFDPKASGWVQRRKAEGYSVHISGVQ